MKCVPDYALTVTGQKNKSTEPLVYSKPEGQGLNIILNQGPHDLSALLVCEMCILRTDKQVLRNILKKDPLFVCGSVDLGLWTLPL